MRSIVSALLVAAAALSGGGRKRVVVVVSGAGTPYLFDAGAAFLTHLHSDPTLRALPEPRDIAPPVPERLPRRAAAGPFDFVRPWLFPRLR